MDRTSVIIEKIGEERHKLPLDALLINHGHPDTVIRFVACFDVE